MGSLLFGGVIVLKNGHARPAIFRSKLISHFVIILRRIWYSRQRRPMRNLQKFFWLDLKYLALIFKRLALPHASINNWTADLPIRNNLRAEQILFDEFGVGQS